MFRRNVFFIALKYLNLGKESNKHPSLAFDGIDIYQRIEQCTGDTVLQLALTMGKWETAKKILSQLWRQHNQFFGRYTPFSRYQTQVRICLNQKDSSSNEFGKRQPSQLRLYGNTALHFAILSESKIVVEELLKRKDVDVNVKNNDNHDTTLHFTAKWTDFPTDLFRIVLEKSTDVNKTGAFLYKSQFRTSNKISRISKITTTKLVH